jgi:putative ABC transport system permease protein
MRFRLPNFFPRETFLMALDSVMSHKFRSALTMLGIVIGVSVAIVVASILSGMRQNIVKIVEEYGTNNIYAFHLTTGPQVGERDQAERARKPLTPEDGEAVARQAPAIEQVAVEAPNIGGWGSGFDDTISVNGKTYRRGNTRAVTANMAEVGNIALKEGRFISEQEDLNRRNVMVIGVNAAEALFPGQESGIVGTKVKMGGIVWEIIGVLAKRKATFFGENEEDNAVFVPFRTGRQVAPGRKFVVLVMRARSGQLQAAVNQVEEVLRARRNVRFNEPNNFDVKTADAFVTQFDSIFGMIGIIAIAISSVGLMVGGIGVMNIMLVSVTERTREIGVRKAVGARRRDIITQFLIEAVTLTGAGGVLGILLGVGLALLIKTVMPTHVPLWAPAVGFGVSVALGVGFGLWPAWKAARLDPVDALPFE